MSMTAEEMQPLGEELLDGIHDVFERTIAKHPKGLPLALIASVFATEINVISREKPDFLKMVLTAVERQNA